MAKVDTVGEQVGFDHCSAYVRHIAHESDARRRVSDRVHISVSITTKCKLQHKHFFT